MAALTTPVEVSNPIRRLRKNLVGLARQNRRPVRICRDARGMFWVAIQRNPPGQKLMNMVLLYGGFASRKFAEGVAFKKTGQVPPVRTVDISDAATADYLDRMERKPA